MKPLNRPMFQRGGKVSSRNNGIVSGFENGGRVRQNFQEGGPGFVDAISEYIKEPERQQGLSTSDYLRIASAGADIMGAQPTGRSGFIGALQAASPALGSLGRDLGTSMGEREAAYQDQLNKRNQLLASAGVDEARADKEIAAKIAAAEVNASTQKDLQKGMIDFETKQNEISAIALEKSQGLDRESAEFIAQNKSFANSEKIDRYAENFAKKRIAEQALETETDPTLIQKLQDDIAIAEKSMEIATENTSDSELFGITVAGFLTDEASNRKLSLVEREIQQMVESGELEKFSEEYFAKSTELTAKEISTILDGAFLASEMVIDKYREGNANGGRVGLQGGGDPMMEQMPGPGATQTTTMEQQPTQITFAELRKRLPPEVTDKVITLLTQSEEALLDFTRIQVPEDINKFNQKYGADLTLPTQVA